MTMRSVLLLLVMGLACMNTGPAFAGEDPGQKSSKSKLDGLLDLMSTVNGLQIPDLTGLIQPEEMGMLTDNKSNIRDNQTHLLSDNETDVGLLSSNRLQFFSGIRLFSGITVHVHVSVQDGDARPSKAKDKKDGSRRNAKKPKKSKKSDSPKTAQKTKRQ